MGILDIFKEETKFVTGLNIDTNGDFQLIELQKINTSCYPVFTHIGVLENFAQDGIFRKKSFIKKFKEIHSEIQSEKLFLNSFKNKKLENEIKSALKITGFTNISIVPKKNIEGIILPAHSDFQQMSVYFSNNEITFTTTENGKITHKEILKMSDFKVSAVTELTAHLDQKHIFLSGIKPELTAPVIGVFYQAGIKTHLQNIWENFLHFSDGIPKLFPAESHIFISALSLAVPGMIRWKTKISNSEIPESKEEKNILKSETIFLPKAKQKKFLKKPTLKKSINAEKKPTKNIHKLKTKKHPSKNKIKNIKKSERGLDYNLKNSKKTYLPKKVKKMFLPKPKETGIWKKVKNILNSEI